MILKNFVSKKPEYLNDSNTMTEYSIIFRKGDTKACTDCDEIKMKFVY